MDAGLLAVKSPARAKQRLGPALDASQRQAVARALVDDSLSLCESSSFLRWWVVSDDDDILASAGAKGFRTVKDGGRGLNDALALALEEIVDAGANSVTILPADLPLASHEDLLDVVDTGEVSDVVVVPSRRDGGTNALYLRPPGVIAPAFGPHSLPAHVRAAEESGLRCSILPLGRLELDLDTPEDVTEFLAGTEAPSTSTGRVLRKMRGREGTD